MTYSIFDRLMPYFQIVEPTKDIIENLEKREDVEALEAE